MNIKLWCVLFFVTRVGDSTFGHILPDRVEIEIGILQPSRAQRKQNELWVLEPVAGSTFRLDDKQISTKPIVVQCTLYTHSHSLSLFTAKWLSSSAQILQSPTAWPVYSRSMSVIGNIVAVAKSSIIFCDNCCSLFAMVGCCCSIALHGSHQSAAARVCVCWLHGLYNWLLHNLCHLSTAFCSPTANTHAHHPPRSAQRQTACACHLQNFKLNDPQRITTRMRCRVPSYHQRSPQSTTAACCVCMYS